MGSIDLSRDLSTMKFLLVCLLIASTQAVPFRTLVRSYGGGRIVGGQEASPGQFPYQVSFRDVSLTLDFHFCGASVYDENTIITAAHCVAGEDFDNPDKLEIVAGEQTLHDSDGDGTEQRRTVTKIISNEDYGSFKTTNDIALLKIDSSLDFSSSAVQPIELPASGESFTGSCIVSGWGTTSSGGSSPDVLRYVSVPLVSDEDCRAAYGDNNILDSMLCAGEGGKDSCQGDSGGPLACSDKLAGIVSWGYGCADPDYPGVYTEVSYFINWINANA